MYEIMKWGEAYPKSEFKFSWKIVNFVQSGKRLSLENIGNEEMKEIISNSWKQDIKKKKIIDLRKKYETIPNSNNPLK